PQLVLRGYRSIRCGHARHSCTLVFLRLCLSRAHTVISQVNRRVDIKPGSCISIYQISITRRPISSTGFTAGAISWSNYHPVLRLRIPLLCSRR
ncbi:hypothetical protein F5X96DRAFT_623478, partial [Biscogniauxia mediterranea]